MVVDEIRRSARGRRALWVMRLLVIGVVAVCTWGARLRINPDGIAYLDVSDYFLAHGLSDPHVGYWSPLFPFVLALARGIFGSGPQYERQIAHVVNFCVFIVALVAYELYLRAQWRAVSTETVDGAPGFPWTRRALAFFAFGYLLLTWMGVELVSASFMTPDMLTAAALFAAAALVLHIDARAEHRHAIMQAVALGIVLGLGYLGKAVMFVVALVLLATLAAHAFRRARSLAPVTIATACFLLTSAPGIWSASRVGGHLTFGDSGRLNYAWFIGGVPAPYWFVPGLAVPAPLTRPAHVDRVHGVSLDTLSHRSLRPRVYDIDNPSIGGTMPLWYDAVQWYPRAFHFTPSLRRQQHVIRENLMWLWGHFDLVFLGALIVLGVGGTSLRGAWPVDPTLIVPCTVVVALYVVVYIETRYVGPFIIVAAIAGVAGAFASGPEHTRAAAARVARRTALIVAAVQVLRGMGAVSDQVQFGLRDDVDGALARAVVASVGEHARVAIIGDPFAAHWTRLARSRVVAFVPPAEAEMYWAGPDSARAAIVDSLRALRVALIVADQPPVAARVDTTVWHSVPGAPEGTLVRRP